MPRECLAVIESKSKARYSHNKLVVAKVSTNTSTSSISPDVAELKDMVKALLLDKKSQNQAPATLKVVEESFFHPPDYQAPAPQTQGVSKEDLSAYVKANDAVMRTMQTQGQNLQNQLTNLTELLTKFVNTNSASTSSSSTLPSNTIANPRINSPIIKPVITPVSAPRPNPRPLIPCPSILKVECLALADLGASINLMPLSVWNKLSLLDLTPTCMTLELADSSISRPVGVAEDVYVKVSTFHFPTDFIVIDFDADPRVPLILERSFLKTEIALIDVFEGELTLHVGKEAITFNLDQTSRYSANYNEMTAKRIDVIDMACEEYSQEIMGFSDVIMSGNPTPYYDPIVSTTSPTLTPFENSDFLLEEVDAFLALEDDPTSSEVDQSYIDSKGDVLLLEAFLNDDPSLPPPNQGNYLPEVRKELKICKAKSEKSSIDEPPEVELKDLLPHHEYVFLEGNDKLPVIIVKDLSVDEKIALIMVLKSHKRAIAWKLSDIKGIDPEFCTYKILIEEDFEPVKTIEVFMDDFLVFGNSFQSCLSHLERMLKRCEDTNLCLNWEKSHFMVKEGIVIGQKISKQRIEVDKAKVDVITKLPHPTTVKEFTFKVIDTKGAENLAANHLFGLENPHQNVLNPKEINESFSLETLNLVSTRGNSSTPRFADFANYHAGNFVVKGMSSQQKRKFFKDLKNHFWTTLFYLTYVLIKSLEGDHKKVQLNELNELCDQDYENSLIYKEKTKRLYDSKIKDRVFNIGDRVLLFNSRLKIFFSKLKSRSSGPFTISYVYPYGTVELSQPDGPNFKVNGHRLKHYFGEDVTKTVVPDLQTFPKDH
nr:reverse transcriptase domain-containing protein [Tanacetum cinerariifolium]